MAEQATLGNNAEQPKTYVSDPATIKAQLEAQIKEGEQMVKPIVDGEDVVTDTPAPATAPGSDQAQKPATPTEGKKVDSLQQFRNKEGEVDESKIAKSNEHLEKSIGTKEERLQNLLATNKELMRKHTKVSQELKAAEKSLPDPTLADVQSGKLSPELKKKILEDLERDPAETILRLTEATSQRNLDARLSPWEEKWRRNEEGDREKSFVNDLDNLGQNGHPWVYTQEGRERFDAFFADNPWVLQSKNPYTAAVKLMGIQASDGNGQAQPVKAPTLGSFHAAPPPVSSPPATPETDMVNLGRQLQTALSVGDLDTARKVQLKMDILHRQMMPDMM